MSKQCLDKDIRITPAAGRITVRFDGKIIASSIRALDLVEPGSPLRIYIPREDVDASVLQPSDHHSFCPYKGEASYYSLKAEQGDSASNAVWYYPDTCPLVEPIRDYLAFWGDRTAYGHEAA
ncbi:MAG TPA: DUF427 domain-containing protein [Arsenicitalea sp.]|jgi:uncharacterized protein (DUF427 family)|nr:DUF427 domain-containing protein [Arsenicitalea sp.]